MAIATSYLRYRQWVNCQGGGYLEDYNLNPALGTTISTNVAVLRAVKSIFCLRGQLLDGNSGIANGEISVETIPGSNPAEGFQIPHSFPVTNPATLYYPVLLRDPTTGVAETTINVAQDPGSAIGWRLDAGIGFSELRTLRSLRSTWVQQWGVLYPQIVNALANLYTASPPSPGTLYTTFPTYAGVTTNPAACIAFYMLVVMVNTALVQLYPSKNSVTGFQITTYNTPNSTGSPATVNPIISQNLTYRKIGEGWPKTHGKMQTFGTHG